MATIRDVAKLAGVSVATVSRYLNGTGYVKEETAKKIKKIIDEVEYVPNEVARSLFQKKSKLIGVILPDIANPYFPLLAKGIEETLQNSGYMMLLANISESKKQLESYLTAFEQNNVAGIITTMPLPKIKNMKIVGVDRVYEGEFPKVIANNYMGGQMIGDLLNQTPCEKILVITGELKYSSVKKRLDGFNDTFDARGKEVQYLHTTFEVNAQDLLVDSIFKNYPAIDTIVAANDYLALKIIQSAQRLGKRIPEDIQIIGYDGIPFSEMSYPMLTTIKQPIYEIGNIGAEKMLDVLQETESVEEKEIVLPVSLSFGESLRKTIEF